MAENDSWVYQGRQYHMWFGHGTKPFSDKALPPPKDSLPSLQDRIHNLGYTLAAGLPASKRHHAVARLDPADRGRLARVMTGVVNALPLGPRIVPLRVLGTKADAPGITSFIKAGAVIEAADSHADVREATDLVGRSAQEMGLDQFRPFLREADDHLSQTGGMVALLRDIPVPTAPSVARPPVTAPTGPGLTPAGQLGPLLRTVLRGALVGVAAGLLEAYTIREQEQQIRDVIDRFKLDPTNPADAAAALAFRWAQNKGPWLFDTPQTGPAMQAMAERVMRAVQADPTLLGRALDGDRASMTALTTMAQGKTVPGSGIETRNDDEASLVAQMMSEGRTGEEIQTALDYRRANGKPPTAEERRNTPGIAVVSTPLPHVDGPWLTAGNSDDGAPIPAQVAERLVGQRFASFGDLRAAIWKAIAETPELAREFDGVNLRLMRDGSAPYPVRSEQVVVQSTGKPSQRTWELHHEPAIGQGGEVYDLSALRVVTPRQHDALTKKGGSK